MAGITSMINALSKAHTMWMCALSEELTRTEPGRPGRTVQRPAAGANQGFLYVRPKTAMANWSHVFGNTHFPNWKLEKRIFQTHFPNWKCSKLEMRILELTTAFCHVTTSPLYGQEKQLAQDENLTLYS
ncbi:MAG: hypothetical protein GY830_10385 [Bacteroidetes bacterium]|nr:hypothetical protein [Bacteroidota bacterium]